MKFLANPLNFKKILISGISLLVLTGGLSPVVFALTYKLQKDQKTVGEYQQITAEKGVTLYEVAENFDIGVGEIAKANPTLNHKPFKEDTEVIIPAIFALPSGPREGIVLNLANNRLFYFSPDGKEVKTYPVGIGRQGWATPVGTTNIVDKIEHPAWHPTPAIRREAESKGILLPAVVPAGPHNPLGQYAMHLGIPGILIHGTNTPHTVGLQSSHGCIRMYADDIKELFSLSEVGTKVRIVYEPHQTD